jgi:nicotinamide mononucleotide adenylyltransferase
MIKPTHGVVIERFMPAHSMHVRRWRIKPAIRAVDPIDSTSSVE